MTSTDPIVGALALDTEENEVLRKHRQTLAKKFKPTRMEQLFEALDLAWMLTAAGREREGAHLSGLLCAHVPFTGNQNIWTPVGYAACHQAFALRAAGGDAGGHAALALIRERPFHIPLTGKLVAEMSRKVEAEVDRALTDTPKWARQGLCRGLARVSFFLETGREGAGFAWSGTYALEIFERHTRAWLTALGERL